VGSETLRWNGTAWAAIATPRGAAVLDGVACTAASFCLAVGQNDSALAAAGEWNGTSWSSPAVHNPGSADNVLNAVKCAQVASPTPDWISSTDTGTGDAFTALSCTSTVCTAVGGKSPSAYFNPGYAPGTVIAARN
jgi:hypothetical protein